MLRDLRFALRLLAKDRWFAAAAVTALALGIGVNATVFTLVNAVLIRGLPFPEADRLLMVDTRNPSGENAGVSYPDLQDWREQSRTFEGLGAFTSRSVNISDDEAAPVEARGTRLTANAFGLLRQQPVVGRDFGPDDDRPGAQPVVILGHRLWMNRYGGETAVLGRTVRLNGEPTTIIGVMPEGMMFPTNAELWTPFVPETEQQRRDGRGLAVFGRLRPDATRAMAQTEMDGVAARLAAAYPETNKEFASAIVETFNDRFNGGPIRIVFLALLGAVGFVLLIACANVANLLLSRSVRRAREIGVRLALGATRWRVVRQLLAESVLLGCLGGVIGLLLALVGVRLFDAAVADVGKPYWIDFRMDFLVFGYLAAICIATGVIFGLAPALHAARANVTGVLNEAGRGNTGSRRTRWLSSTMVVSELALTIVLLVGAGLMIRSFLNMSALDLGIQTDHLMTMRLQLPGAKYRTPESRVAFFEQLAPRLAAIPGADAAALTTSVPPSGAGRRSIEIDGQPPVAATERPQASAVTISPGFFETTGVTLLRGRDFDDRDGTPGRETVIVNERLAERFFPGEDPLGRRIRFPTTSEPAPVWRTIVGISPSIRHNSPQEAAPAAAVYLPYRQDPPIGIMLLVRSRLEPAAVMKAVSADVQAIDRDQPVFSIQTLNEALTQARWPFRVFGSLFAVFAGIALVLSAVGLYAVMAYSVTERQQELGVRMALGAGRRQVSWLVLRRGLLQLSIGLTLGLAGAFFVSVVLESLLVQVPPRDPVTFAVITAMLCLVALAACLIPARRATRLDPVAALRN